MRDPNTSVTHYFRLFVEFENFYPNLEVDKNESVVLIVGLVTSTLRACRSLNSKLVSSPALSFYRHLTTDGFRTRSHFFKNSQSFALPTW